MTCHRTANYKLQSYGSCTLHVIFWCLIFARKFYAHILNSFKLKSKHDCVKKLVLKKFEGM